MTLKDYENIVAPHVVQLMEHFEAVEIFVTCVDEEGDTVTLAIGRGNSNTRFGMISRWIDAQDLCLNDITDEAESEDE